MNGKKRNGRVRPAESEKHFLLLLSAGFLSGILAGYALSVCSMAFFSTKWSAFLCSFLMLAKSSGTCTISVPGALWMYIKYPLLAWGLGFLSAAAVLLPLLMVYLGMLSAFSVMALIWSVGENGALLAVLLFGLPNLIILPCCFFLAACGMHRREHCKTATGGFLRGAAHLGRIQVVQSIACFLILVFGALAYSYWMPQILQSVAELISV